MKAKILVVDDHKLTADMFGALLCEDCEVTTCYHVDEALKLLNNSEQFDIVVTDYDNPRPGGGAQIAETVRAWFPGVPVIVMTGNTDTNRVRNLCKPDALFLKPFHAKEMQETIAHFAERKILVV